MTTNPKPKRRLLPIILGASILCFALAAIGALLSPPADPANTTVAPTLVALATSTSAPTTALQPTSTSVPTATPQPTSTPTLDALILAAIGRTNRADAPAPRVTAGEQIIVTAPINDNFSTNLIRRGAWLRILAIAQAVRDNTGNAHDLSITLTGPLTDAYGNTSEQTLIRVDLSRATLARVNFDGIDPANLPAIADEYIQHPALND